MKKERVFIALIAPEPVMTELFEVRQQLIKIYRISRVSWIKPDYFHITLHFLGYQGPEEIRVLTSRVLPAVAAIPGFNLSLRDLGAFPGLRNPRVIWAGVDTGNTEIIRIQEELGQTLIRESFNPETRKFHPHFTLGRVKNTIKADLREAAEKIVIPPLPGRVDRIMLMKSDLRPEGAVHTIIAEQLLLG